MLWYETMGITLNIDLDEVLEFLDDLIEAAEDNLKSYEDFDGEIFHLANLKNMHSMEAFLYGVANGKKDQLQSLKDYVEAKVEEFKNGY